MATYSVYAFCDSCGEVHPMGISIGLADGPSKKESIGDAYSGKDLPTSIATMTSNKFQCPKTGQLTNQKDNNQVFLVPISD